VGDLDGQSSVASGTQWRAQVVILVHNASHNPIPGAIVTGIWSNASNNPVSCTTNSIGSCILARNGLRFNNDPSVTFTVSNVSLTAYTYNPAANHDPETDSNGTAITVAAPIVAPTSTATATASPTP
jgi:hypothetical protein